jgi:hypothetical protein
VLAVLTLPPAGFPSALRFMPGLLDAVKSAVSREAAQLFDKLTFVAGKVRSIHINSARFQCKTTLKPSRQPHITQADSSLLVQHRWHENLFHHSPATWACGV